MTARPADRIPVTGPDTGPYEVIHLGGQGSASCSTRSPGSPMSPAPPGRPLRIS